MSTRPSIVVVVNPRAGRERGGAIAYAIEAALRARAEPFALRLTQAPGHARDLAAVAAAEGCRLIVAAGGDGTLNEVANGVLDAGAGGSVAIGIVHLGRAGDVARMLKLPSDPAAAIAHACHATPRPIDVGIAQFADGSRRAFLNAAGAGLDAAVAAHAARSRLPGTTLPYLAGVARALVRERPVEMRVTADGARWEGAFRVALVANGPFVGGGLRLVPAARIDDGRLDLALVGPLPARALLRQLPRIFSGRHADHPSFTTVAAREVAIDSDRPLPVEVDGEATGTTPVRFTVAPGALLAAA